MPDRNPIRPAINPHTDIPIPDDIYIEEQYADILDIVDYILPLLEPYKFDNSTSEGRLRGELSWLKQEVETQKFQIPNTRSILATTSDLGKNYYLTTDIPNVQNQLKSLVSLIQCNSFIKPRHYPRVIELIDNVKIKAEEVVAADKAITPDEKKHMLALISELEKIGRLLYAEENIFPLTETDWPAYCNKVARGDVWDRNDNYYKCEVKLSGPFMSRWRPRQSQPTPGWEMPEWVKGEKTS